MADSHTPGPWTVHYWESSVPGGGIPSSLVQHAEGDEGDVVLDIAKFSEEHGNLPLDEQIANANLIAAAPCLLDALRNLLRETDPITVGCPDIHRAREAARAAIAKAEEVSGG